MNVQALIDGSQCIDRCLPDGFKMSVLLNLSVTISNIPPTPSGNFRITEALDIRVTEDGSPRIIE